MCGSPGVHRYLPAAFATYLVVVCMAPTLARGETYGQLTRFGTTGTGHGEFDIRKGDNAFGVDPIDNSVYVGDEPGTKKGEYRIQKLTASGTYVAATALLKPPKHDGIEGVAVDPAEKRIYVLAMEERSTSLAVAPGKPAAGTLYAFSTEPSGETLMPATGANSEGVLVGPSTFEPQSEDPEQALLNPKGITVDPSTHDVIILGETYQGVENGSEESSTLVAIQRILPSGTLGERYVDRSEFFGPNDTPNSPVVSATGDVYVVVGQTQVYENKATKKEEEADEFAQIPSEFSLTAPPAPFGQLILRGELEDEIQPVATFPSEEQAEHGDGLSLTTDGPNGSSALFARAGIFVRPGETGGSFYPGALAFDGLTGAELGWTGGQITTSSKSCAIGFGGVTYPAVAAGSGGMLFIFDPANVVDTASEIVVFGPGGSGCPAAQATEPTAEIDGKAVAPAETVSAGVPVTFSSQMAQTNALSVEWSFGDGQTTTVGADEYQHTEVTHSFVRGGELTVTETIHTDDLDTPTIVKHTTISVSTTAPPPTAVLEGPTEVTLGPTELERLVYLPGGELGVEKVTQDGVATFNASASTASTATGPNQIAEYHWAFGDGESKTTDTDTVEHAYTTPNSYVVQLTVTDALGHTSEPVALTVKVKEPPPPASKGTGGSSAPSVGTTPAPTTTTGQTATTTSKQSPTPTPDAHLVSTSITVSSSGAVNLDVSCPTGEIDCAGTVTLRTLDAVILHAAGSHPKKKTKATILTLANGAFTVTGGDQRSFTLHLTSEARALLASVHVVRVQATLIAHDPSGHVHTTRTDVTLRASKGSQQRRK